MVAPAGRQVMQSTQCPAGAGMLISYRPDITKAIVQPQVNVDWNKHDVQAGAYVLKT